MPKGPNYCSGPDYRVLPASIVQGKAMCGQLGYKHAQVTDACENVTGDVLLGFEMTSKMWSGVESGFSLVPWKLMSRSDTTKPATLQILRLVFCNLLVCQSLAVGLEKMGLDRLEILQHLARVSEWVPATSTALCASHAARHSQQMPSRANLVIVTCRNLEE